MADDDKKPKEEIPAEEPKEEQPPEQPKEEESPADESEPEEQSSEEPSEAEAVEETPHEEEPQPMSRRKAKRLEKLEGLVERLRGQDKPVPKAKGIDYREMIEAPDEVYQQLEAKSQEYGQAQYNAGLEQAKAVQFHTRLEIDAPKIEDKYPQFNKDSAEFNPAVANAINQWYLATVGYDAQTDTVNNPNVRYSDFVEGIMELADGMAGVKAQKTTENIAKQAASTGLRPDGTSAKGLNLSKAPEDMTDEELEAAMAAVLPTRDARGRLLRK